MTKIRLETLIHAPQEVCFTLSHSIDLHVKSMNSSREQAIAGKQSGLLERGEWVTWKARHFGFWHTMTIGMKKMLPYSFFEDVMLQGPFKNLRHLHIFSHYNGVTRMTDVFEYEVPFGYVGRLFDRWILKNYLTRLLQQRNEAIKCTAEDERYSQNQNESLYA